MGVLVKIICYSIIVAWGALALFAYKNVKKTLRKYRNIKEVQDQQNWKGTKRMDFNKWDEKEIIKGCFLRFPLKVAIMVFLLVTFILVVLLQDLLAKIHKKCGKTIIKTIGFKILRFVYDIVEYQPLHQLRTAIVISNHVNWFDIVYHSLKFFPISFVSKAEMERVPVVGKIAQKIQCVFLERENEKARVITLEKIQRQISAYNSDSERYNPLIIFPQGTTSNGRSIIRFKIGAFQNKSKITIVSFNYSCNGFDMGMDEVIPIEHFIISLCLKPRLEVRFKEVEPAIDQSPEEYMARCQKELSMMTGYPIEQSGFTEKKKLELARFGNKQD